jgi:hypothetical protein
MGAHISGVTCEIHSYLARVLGTCELIQISVCKR